MKIIRHQRELILYLVKFLGLFCLLFYGTEGVIGLSAPDNNYSAFVAGYLDFITPFRQFLLSGAVWLLSLVDFRAGIRGDVIYREGGEALRMSYSCIGYGVLSFWMAFVLANRGSWNKKLGWALGGCLLLCAINILRVSLLLVALNRGWPIPFGWDHHTWFNIVCYGVIFGMIYFFDKTASKGRTEYPKELSSIGEKEQWKKTVRQLREKSGVNPKTN